MTAWWQDAVFYEVYPRSFQDSDGDGTGDLRGITQRLDYLAGLGVDAVWVAPVFPSPMTDFGYDVSDYCGIDPRFGSLADMDALVAAAHGRGMRVVLDFVPNHTSDRHPWFIDSARGGAKRDWYIWRDAAADGGPPNNWLSNFGGAGWTWHAASGQFYYHAFLPTQPDLNWRNPAVQAAMLDVLRFWLARGVDGFRVDVMWMMVKDDQFRDNPPNPDHAADRGSHDRLLPVFTEDRPEVHGIVAAMRAVLDDFGDRVLIGEIYLPVDRLVTYYGCDGRGAHLPFNFHLLLLERWTAAGIADIVTRYEAALPPGAWPNWVLGNHDRSRVATRLGPAQARVAALLLLTLRGTPTLYMGDELGMADTPIPADEVQDPAGLREPGRGRDPERTPFPWQAGPGGGFTSGTPWLRLGHDTPLSVQQNDPASAWTLHRDLLALRRSHAALRAGDIEHVRADGPVLSFVRRSGAEVLTVLANIGGTAVDGPEAAGTILLSTAARRTGVVVSGRVALAANEAVVLRPDATGR